MKKLGITVAALLGLLISLPSLAANVSAPFNVIINLTSACTISTPANITLNYTAGSAAAVTGTTAANVTCTNTLPYTLSMNGLKGAGNYAPAADAATGLSYTLSFTAAGTGGADVAGAGTGAAQAITIGANITAGQWGTCATATCTNGAGVVQTVYVNY